MGKGFLQKSAQQKCEVASSQNREEETEQTNFFPRENGIPTEKRSFPAILSLFFNLSIIPLKKTLGVTRPPVTSLQLCAFDRRITSYSPSSFFSPFEPSHHNLLRCRWKKKRKRVKKKKKKLIHLPGSLPGFGAGFTDKMFKVWAMFVS